MLSRPQPLAMVTIEALQAMMSGLQEQNRNNMVMLANQHIDALKEIVKASKNNSSGLTDVRGVGRPTTFRGEEEKYCEWKAKLFAYLRMSAPKSMEWITWASTRTSRIQDQDIKDEYEPQDSEVKDFSVKLYAILLSCTEDDAFRISHSVGDGNGLEALRLLMRRYEPKTPGTKRAVLKTIINNSPAKKPDEVEKNLMQVEELMRRYEQMADKSLPEDLKVTVIIDLCPKDFREHLELTTKDKEYKEVREEVMSYVERKREQFGSQLKAMEVDNYEEEWMNGNEFSWWGGDSQWQWGDTDSGDAGEGCGDMCPFMHKGGKKGGQFPKGKGKGSQKGYKGKSHFEKGKGKGYGEKGKGKGANGVFQGTCHWCGEWGHSQSRCRLKDEYMEGVRRARGQEQTYSVEPQDAQGKSELEALEARRNKDVVEWRSLCMLESNRFAPLSDPCAGEDATFPHIDVVEKVPSASPLQENRDAWEVVQSKKTRRGIKTSKSLLGEQVARVDVCDVANSGSRFKAKRWSRREELSSLEASEVALRADWVETMRAEINGMDSDGANLWITVDSGASENVISETMAPQFTTKPSRGSRGGVKYVTASGSVMNNKGEKEIKVRTQEGHKCMLRMQVTDVQKPLMSVSRVCDAGHRVVFTRDGGYIEHEESGQKTEFMRVDNVYRLNVEVAQADADFSRRGH